MRYQVTNLNDLINIISEIDDEDRIGFIAYDEDKPVGRNKIEFTFRFNKNFIKLHEIREVEK